MRLLITITILMALLSNAHAGNDLGKNHEEFERIKARVTDQIKGTEATVSERDLPKFADHDIQAIKEAQRLCRAERDI